MSPSAAAAASPGVRPASLVLCALSALAAIAVLFPTPPVAATAQFNDAADYADPLPKAVMECSDIVSPAIAEIKHNGKLYSDLARACCEDVALSLMEGHSMSSATATSVKCFSRTLFPRDAKPTVDRLLQCLRDVLSEESDY